MGQDVKIIVLWIALQEIFIVQAILSHGTTTVQVVAIVCQKSMLIMDAPIFAIHTKNVIGKMRISVNLMMKMAA
jgi:hypothetical protein